MLQRNSTAIGFIEPCLPSPAKTPPTGADWLHEIKHDGFRILARRDAKGVRLYTRNGNDFTARFLLIVASVMALPVRSCLIDGEVIVSDRTGLAVFDLLRSWHHDHAAVLCAFDLLEFDGQDLRRLPIEQRKRMLARLVQRPTCGYRTQRALRRRRRNRLSAGLQTRLWKASCRSGSARHTARVDRSNW